MRVWIMKVWKLYIHQIFSLTPFTVLIHLYSLLFQFVKLPYFDVMLSYISIVIKAVHDFVVFPTYNDKDLHLTPESELSNWVISYGIFSISKISFLLCFAFLFLVAHPVVLRVDTCFWAQNSFLENSVDHMGC